MADKTFTVRSINTGQVLTVQGKSLEDALKREWLNPGIWVEAPPEPEPEPEISGQASETAE